VPDVCAERRVRGREVGPHGCRFRRVYYVMTTSDREYVLMGTDRKSYRSRTPGTLGGHRGGRIYGRLDCPAALRAIAKGGYGNKRVFFADEATANAAGFRPCGVCMPQKYRAWKLAQRTR
jgi:hypothetical protein